jgi:hypothetical protein
MRRLLLMVFAFALPVAADPPARWRLDYESEIPERFQTADGAYWAVVFTLTNRGPQPAPLAVGHEIRRAGKEEIRESFLPDPFLVFFCEKQGLKGASRADREAALALLQEKGRWLTTTALTGKRELAAGESLHAVAVLREEERVTSGFSVIVQGLEDPIAFWPETWEPLPFVRFSLRLRTNYELQGGALQPSLRNQFVSLPSAPVNRKHLVALVAWLEDENPRVRRTALDLLCCYADPTIPRPTSSSSVQVPWYEVFMEAKKFLKGWLHDHPVIRRLQREAPGRRKEWAADLLRRDPDGMKGVAAALEKEGDFEAFDVADSLIEALDHQGDRCCDVAWSFIRELVVRSEYDYEADTLDPSAPAAAKSREAWKEWVKRFSANAIWVPSSGTWEIKRR